MKPKICFITLRSDTGGAPQHLYDLIRRVNNYCQSYIASPLDEPFGNLFKSECFKHFTLPHRFFSLSRFIKLIIFLKKNQIHLIHSHGRGAGIYSRLLKLFGFKIIHTFHGIHKESKLKLLIDKFLRFLTDQFILVSESELREAINYNQTIKSKSVIINNGIDTSIATLKMPKIKNANNIFTVGIIARFDYQKGLDILINHLSIFRKMYPELYFIVKIAGAGKMKDDLVKNIKKKKLKNIELVGLINNPYAFLSSIDLFISTSRWEAAIPYTVMEALYTNCPILISNVPGHIELKKFLKDDLFVLDDYEDFSKKFLKKLQNNNKKDTKQIVIDNFNADLTASKTIEIYKKYEYKRV